MRQLIKLTRLKRTYRKSSSKNGVYECEIDVDDEKTILWTFKLGEEFENEYLEGRNHTVRLHSTSHDRRNEQHGLRSFRKHQVSDTDLFSAAGFRLKSRTTTTRK